LTAGSRLTLNILAYFRVQQQLRHQCFFFSFLLKKKFWNTTFCTISAASCEGQDKTTWLIYPLLKLIQGLFKVSSGYLPCRFLIPKTCSIFSKLIQGLLRLLIIKLLKLIRGLVKVHYGSVSDMKEIPFLKLSPRQNIFPLQTTPRLETLFCKPYQNKNSLFCKRHRNLKPYYANPPKQNRLILQTLPKRDKHILQPPPKQKQLIL